MINILHLHDQPKIKGGAEVYLNQLNELLPKYNISSNLIFIEKQNSGYIINENKNKIFYKSLNDVIEYINSFIVNNNITHCFIHNLFITEIDCSLKNKVKLFKIAHGPVLSCPGKDKYWRYSNTPCVKPFGLHCLYHIYSEGCSNRHPKRVYDAYTYVQESIRLSKDVYDKIIVMSDWNKSTLLELNIPNSKIEVIPYFTDYVSSDDINKNTFAEQKLLFIGRITLGKGVDELIQVYEMLISDFPNIQLDIIGDGKEIHRIREYVNSKKHYNVRFQGWKKRDEIKLFIKNATLTIFPSTYPETFGIVGIESMMWAKPVVGFDVGGVSTWLKDGVNGFLVENKDIEAMYQSIKKILSSQDLYLKFSNDARAIAEKDYIENKHMRQIIDLLN